MFPMNINNNDTELNSFICEAVGCSARATNTIEVKVGTLGIISLLLCNDCISKFQENKVYRIWNQNPDSNGVEAK